MAAFTVEGAAGYYYLVSTTTGEELFKGDGLSKAEIEAKAARLNAGYAAAEASSKAGPTPPAATKTDTPTPPTETQATVEAKAASQAAKEKTKPSASKSEDDSAQERDAPANANATGTPPTAPSNTSAKQPLSIPGAREYNPLSTLSSYTYNLTLYMVNPTAYNAFALSGGRVVNNLKDENGNAVDGFYVIAKSGGINNANEARGITFSGTPGTNQPGFDYYIDDLQFDTYLPCKDGTETPTTAVNFNFKVTETTGFNFLSRLNQLSHDILGTDKLIPEESDNVDVVAFQQHYLLGIKFYGYDKDGKLVTSKDFAVGDSTTSLGGSLANGQVVSTDSNAIFERFFPLQLSNITFKINGKAVVYDFTAQLLPLQATFGEKRGLIDSAVEIFASTVEEALLGVKTEGDTAAEFFKTDNSTASQRETDTGNNGQSQNPTANKQPKTNPQKGLLSTLNSKAVTQQLQGKRDMAPKFYIQFQQSDSSIRDARILSDDPQSAAGSGANRSGAVNAQTANNAQTKTARGAKVSIPSGTPIIQAINNIISQSTYVDDALNVINTSDPETKARDKSETKPLRWYSINPIVKIKGIDSKTKDWVYDICYQIQTFDVPYVRTPNAKVGDYYGPHKRYNYWFTGKNREILAYEQEFNALFYLLDSTTTNSDNSSANNGGGKSVPIIPSSGSQGQSNGPKTNRAALVNQNVSTAIYADADQAHATIKIIGDPDYLFQSIAGGYNIWESANSKIGVDGTIDPNSGFVFIEIKFNGATDYDQDTGTLTLVDADQSISFYQSGKLKDAGVTGLIYNVVKVSNSFSHGKFEQVLDLFIVDEGLLNIPGAKQDEQREQPSGNNAKDRTNPAGKDSDKNVAGRKEPPPTPVKPSGGRGSTGKPVWGKGGPPKPPVPRTTTTKDGKQVADDDGNLSSTVGGP